MKRLEHNPLRILDSKDPDDRGICHAAPKIDEYLSGEAQDFFGAVTAGLDAAGVAWVRNAQLVRGLDYYRHTAFEFVTDRLGAQGTVIGGGRYDGLIENLGGKSTPAVGWAAGIERLAMLVDAPLSAPTEFVIVPIDETANGLALKIIGLLRRNEICCEIGFSGSEKKRYEKAKKSGARHVLNISAGAENIIAELKIRDLTANEELPPIRALLKKALQTEYAVNDDIAGTRIISLTKLNL